MTRSMLDARASIEVMGDGVDGGWWDASSSSSSSWAVCGLCAHFCSGHPTFTYHPPNPTLRGARQPPCPVIRLARASMQLSPPSRLRCHKEGHLPDTISLPISRPIMPSLSSIERDPAGQIPHQRRSVCAALREPPS